MTDFGPMIANPKTLLLGAAAQFGIFASLLGALALNIVPGLEFSLKGCRRHRHYRRRGRADGDLCRLKTRAGFAGCDCGRGVFLYGLGATDTAAHHAGIDDRRRTQD